MIPTRSSASAASTVPSLQITSGVPVPTNGLKPLIAAVPPETLREPSGNCNWIVLATAVARESPRSLRNMAPSACTSSGICASSSPCLKWASDALSTTNSLETIAFPSVVWMVVSCERV